MSSRISLHISPQKTEQSSNLTPKNKGHLLNPKGKKNQTRSVEMVSWTQICAGDQLATMTLLMLYEHGCWRGKTKLNYYLCLLRGWKDVQDIKLLQWTKGCKNNFGEYSKFLENKIEVSAIRKSRELSFRFLYSMISGSVDPKLWTETHSIMMLHASRYQQEWTRRRIQNPRTPCASMSVFHTAKVIGSHTAKALNHVPPAFELRSD